MTDKIDRRVKRTHKFLQNALVSLTLEQGYDSVTIRDITERADVGYATFFRHYADKDALLADVLAAMKEGFLKLLTPNSFATDPERGCTQLFHYVQEYATLFKVLFSSTRTLSLVRQVQEVGISDVMRFFNPEWSESRLEFPIPVEIAGNHLMWSLVVLIYWWLDNDQPHSPEQMGKIAANLIVRPVIMAMTGSSIG